MAYLFRNFICLGAVALMAVACVPTSRTASSQADVAAFAGKTLIQNCIEPETTLSSLVRAAQLYSGPGTGRTFFPFRRDGELVGALVSDSDSVGSRVVETREGSLFCSVSAFAVDAPIFDKAVTSAIEAEGFVLTPLQGGGFSFAVGEVDVALTFDTGENALGNEARSANLEFGKRPPLSRLRAQTGQRPRAARSNSIAAGADRSSSFPPVAGSGPLFEGSPFEFTAEQLQAYCGQDWRIRIGANGQTEYNPCYERAAFR